MTRIAAEAASLGITEPPPGQDRTRTTDTASVQPSPPQPTEPVPGGTSFSMEPPPGIPTPSAMGVPPPTGQPFSLSRALANAPPPKASGTSDPSREPARVAFTTAPVTLLVDHPADNPPDVVINPLTGHVLRVQPVGNPVGATESVRVAESGPVGTESGPTVDEQIDALVEELCVD